MIQDFVLTILQILIIINLIPQVFDKRTRIPWYSSLSNSLIMIGIGITVFSLGLWFTTVVDFITAIIFLYLCELPRPNPFGFRTWLLASTNDTYFILR